MKLCIQERGDQILNLTYSRHREIKCSRILGEFADAKETENNPFKVQVNGRTRSCRGLEGSDIRR